MGRSSLGKNFHSRSSFRDFCEKVLLMKRQNGINATYHFLGTMFFLIPLIGFVAPAIFYLFRKNATVQEQNHYRAVLNFLFSVFIYILLLYLFFPRSIANVCVVFLCLCAFMITIYNGYSALKGQEPVYPMALPLLKPLKPRSLSVEEMMYLSRNQDS